jgi:hypothetical protein
VDSLINPTGVTSHFVKDSTVFLVMGVRGFPKTETHTISVRWFLQGQDLEIPCAFGQTCQKVNGDSQVDFSLGFPQPGLGMAKVYVDKPDSDKGDDPKDPALAATIYFAVEMPTPVPTPKNGTPSGTPSGSPAGSPTAPPKAYAPTSDARSERAGL